VAKRRHWPRSPGRSVAAHILEPSEASVLDILDHVLAKGVMATGDLTLGVAGVDLIYVRLSALLCAADRLFPDVSDDRTQAPSKNRRRSRRRKR
jgi:hypothetical protein